MCSQFHTQNCQCFSLPLSRLICLKPQDDISLYRKFSKVRQEVVSQLGLLGFFHSLEVASALEKVHSVVHVLFIFCCLFCSGSQVAGAGSLWTDCQSIAGLVNVLFEVIFVKFGLNWATITWKTQWSAKYYKTKPRPEMLKEKSFFLFLKMRVMS